LGGAVDGYGEEDVVEGDGALVEGEHVAREMSGSVEESG